MQNYGDGMNLSARKNHSVKIRLKFQAQLRHGNILARLHAAKDRLHEIVRRT
jgi:hypothetical protein